MPDLARKSGWNAARTEPFDFSLRYSNCPVCRYSGATKDLFSRAALRLQPWQVLGPASALACAHQQPRRAPAPKDGDLVLFEKILISLQFQIFCTGLGRRCHPTDLACCWSCGSGLCCYTLINIMAHYRPCNNRENLVATRRNDVIIMY